jgi:riboflavin kinase/FMN adenylyltransferase
VQIFRSTTEVPSDFGPTAVAIGKFDGVHSGHREVIAELIAVASVQNLVPAAVTFDRNPLSLLRPELCPEPLVSNDQKLDLLADAGLAATLMLTFDRAFADLDPEVFVHSILVDALHAQVVFVGSDFRFGAKGSGTVETLREFGERWGFTVTVVGDVLGDGERRASSTWVRELLAEGRAREATALLGYEPSIRSVVVHGAKRGREMGYPTANLAPAIEGFIPRDGVYAAWLTVDGNRYGAAVSIGNNPTFDGVPDKQVEAHVLDEDLDLYDKVVDVSFVEYIRPMSKFSGMDELVVQMNLDEQQIRAILGYPPVGSVPRP